MLARQTEPLLASEIQALILDYSAVDMVPTIAEVRAILRDNREFVPYRRCRWELGRYAAPLLAKS